jgi:glycosyltransferase involved in cell wall biosynthesis
MRVALTTCRVRPTCIDMEEAWRDIKVLLVPSLWFEAWGIVLIEAHLRGIPVISSDAGALTEAMLGLDHVIRVNRIQGERDKDGEYIVPEQDIDPWVKVVNELMSDKSKYERLSRKVRSTTQQWLKNIDDTAQEDWLIDLALRSKKIGTA